jgi:hypothetical protein
MRLHHCQVVETCHWQFYMWTLQLMMQASHVFKWPETLMAAPGMYVYQYVVLTFLSHCSWVHVHVVFTIMYNYCAFYVCVNVCSVVSAFFLMSVYCVLYMHMIFHVHVYVYVYNTCNTCCNTCTCMYSYTLPLGLSTDNALTLWGIKHTLGFVVWAGVPSLTHGALRVQRTLSGQLSG